MLTVLKQCLLATMVLFASCPAKNTDSGAPGEPAAIVIAGKMGAVRVPVEIVRSDQERARGLMHRQKLAPKSGMLFIFEKDEVQTFWMKNTFIPLDMVFIDRRMKVVGIVENAVPHSLHSRKVDIPSRYVLEVNAGFTAARGIAEGDQVSFEGIALEK
jgi:uncharacterized protein